MRLSAPFGSVAGFLLHFMAFPLVWLWFFMQGPPKVVCNDVMKARGVFTKQLVLSFFVLFCFFLISIVFVRRPCWSGVPTQTEAVGCHRKRCKRRQTGNSSLWVARTEAKKQQLQLLIKSGNVWWFSENYYTNIGCMCWNASIDICGQWTWTAQVECVCIMNDAQRCIWTRKEK